jgi:hypothetical protein
MLDVNAGSHLDELLDSRQEQMVTDVQFLQNRRCLRTL